MDRVINLKRGEVIELHILTFLLVIFNEIFRRTSWALLNIFIYMYLFNIILNLFFIVNRVSRKSIKTGYCICGSISIFYWSVCDTKINFILSILTLYSIFYVCSLSMCTHVTCIVVTYRYYRCLSLRAIYTVVKELRSKMFRQLPVQVT